MDKVDRLRDEIMEKVREYCRLTHERRREFIPGETRINYAGRVFGGDEVAALVDSALEFWLTHGRCSRDFEQKLAETLQVRHALFVNSGSSANLLAFMALTSPLLGDRRIRRGDEVITVACGFPTTVSPIVQYGAVPVFVDVDRNTANIAPELLETAASERTRAVMIAHTLGNPFALKEVKEFCDRRGLWLVEDNCDALGSTYSGRPTGSFGDISTLSFYPPHHLTTGEGGAVCTSDDTLHRVLLSLRDWGRDCHCPSGVDNACGKRFSGRFGTLPEGYDHKYVYGHFGYNLKATDLQAAIGCVQLTRLADFTAARKRNFELLRTGLCDLPELQLCSRYPESDPAWFGFLITVADHAAFSRNELSGFLEKRKIQTRNLFAGNLTRHPCFSHLSEGRDYRIAGTLENTDRIMRNAFWIGVYPGMDGARLEYMISSVRDFIRAGLR